METLPALSVFCFEQRWKVSQSGQKYVPLRFGRHAMLGVAGQEGVDRKESAITSGLSSTTASAICSAFIC
jgi:hypothetical protein